MDVSIEWMGNITASTQVYNTASHTVIEFIDTQIDVSYTIIISAQNCYLLMCDSVLCT